MNGSILNWIIPDEEKEKFISALTKELILLRTKAGISQEELASLIGISRQTYGSIERKTRRMSWSVFLSLILFYDYNQNTHQMIRNIGAFPDEMVKHFNAGIVQQDVDISAVIGDEVKEMVECLDEQALRSIRTLVMVEYARCTNTPGDVVIKAFDGKNFNIKPRTENKAMEAFRDIKERSRQK